MWSYISGQVFTASQCSEINMLRLKHIQYIYFVKSSLRLAKLYQTSFFGLEIMFPNWLKLKCVSKIVLNCSADNHFATYGSSILWFSMKYIIFWICSSVEYKAVYICDIVFIVVWHTSDLGPDKLITNFGQDSSQPDLGSPSPALDWLSLL